MNAEVKYCHPCKDTQAAKDQDGLYGKGMRVHNGTIKSHGDKKQYRCTVCGAIRS